MIVRDTRENNSYPECTVFYTLNELHRTATYLGYTKDK